MKCFLIVTAVVTLGVSTPAMSTPFDPDNLLFTEYNVLREMTRAGAIVRSFDVPHPDTGRHDASDVVVGPDGAAYVRNSAPFSNDYFSRLDPITGMWSHIPADDIGFGNGSDADLSINGNIAVTNGRRLDIAGPSVSSFPLPGYLRGVGEVSWGLDGLLYTLQHGSPRTDVRVVDPTDLSLIRELDSLGGFSSNHRGIAVDASGTIYVADWNGSISAFTMEGAFIASVATGTRNLLDLDLHPDGTLIAGSWHGDVVITDTTLSSVTSLRPNSVGSGDTTYVAFATNIPEPASATVLVIGALLGWRGASARKQPCAA